MKISSWVTTVPYFMKLNKPISQSEQHYLDNRLSMDGGAPNHHTIDSIDAYVFGNAIDPIENEVNPIDSIGCLNSCNAIDTIDSIDTFMQ